MVQHLVHGRDFSKALLMAELRLEHLMEALWATSKDVLWEVGWVEKFGSQADHRLELLELELDCQLDVQ